MASNFALVSRLHSDLEDYIIIDGRNPFSNVISNIPVSPTALHQGLDEMFNLSLMSQQTYTSINDPSTMHVSSSLQGGEGANSSYKDTHIDLDGDELTARLLFLAERTPMTREDLLFGDSPVDAGSTSTHEGQASGSYLSSSRSELADTSLVTPPNRPVPTIDTLSTAFSHPLPRYFGQQSDSYQCGQRPGRIDPPRSPLSYKTPLIEDWKDAILPLDGIFDREAKLGSLAGLGISLSDSITSPHPGVTKRPREWNDEEEISSRNRRKINDKWRMYC